MSYCTGRPCRAAGDVLLCEEFFVEGDSAMSTMPAILSKPPMTVSPEVYEYSRKHGIEAPLQRLLEATPRIYPNAKSIRVYMELDVEIKDMWFIVFEVYVLKADYPDYIVAGNLWSEEWMRAYPYPRNHSFVLDLRRRDA